MRHWSREIEKVEEYRHCRKEKSEALMGMTRTVTDVRILPPAINPFISVDNW